MSIIMNQREQQLDVQSNFDSILSQPQHSRQPMIYQLLCDLKNSLRQNQPPDKTLLVDQINRFVSNLVQDSIGLLISKPILSDLIGWIQALGSDVDDRSLRFQDHLKLLREILADILEEEMDWNGAAQVLKDISMDGSNNQEMYDEYKLRTYIRIVRLLLEDDDPVSAETYLNRASLLIPITTDQTIILSFKLSQARIFDSKRRFEEASKKYHEISLTDQDLAQEERSFCLSASMVCAILAKAGPARTRILRDLYRDSRTRELPNFAILSKMFYDQLIRPDELVEFKKTLKTHHLAKLNNSFAILEEDDDNNSNSNDDEDRRMIVAEDGESCLRKDQVLRDGPETVLDRSIIQHNLLSTSKLYRNISFRALGKYLGLKPFVVESMVRVMIQENRLRAKIDQVDGFIDFDDYCKTDGIESEQVLISNVVLSGSNQKDNTSDKSDRKRLIEILPESIRWDESIRKTSQKVEIIYEHLISSSS
ncbi:hypothetical protein PPACK8108_LOCUS7091 [Phakopsora pachyrhizi]|uniref:COP9 signalosome complex subunit 4 n=1 Tax=Phakopsora pachyrhizi TaxID=170000 RepID=A0AAV0AU10_PHAPC|nr:hypothetical protein PPACK8108_LOCUS7091 [Phakopsora pachyrhizi]